MTQTTALATPEQLAIEDVKRLANIVLSLRSEVFKPDVDYGVIPGTNTKPVLLLPGMEKLQRALHLRPEYVERSKIEDFEHSIIYYRYECRLVDYETGICVATAIGSANSRESKWRWREQKRTCPKCGKETINRSKFPPKGAPQGTEPGWYCYAKIGGCGAEYAASDPAIVNQPIGRVENPDIFDQMNTIDKIAQKRALGSAIKGAANVSEFFTVDLEKFEQYDTSTVIEGSFTVVHDEGVSEEQPSASVHGAGISKPSAPAQPEKPITPKDPLPITCDRLIITKQRQYILVSTHKKQRIPVTLAQLADTNAAGAEAWIASEHPLIPSVSVLAYADPDGWRVESVKQAVPAGDDAFAKI